MHNEMEFSIAVYLQNNYKKINLHYKCNSYITKQKLNILPRNFSENRVCFTRYWHKITLFSLNIFYLIE